MTVLPAPGDRTGGERGTLSQAFCRLKHDPLSQPETRMNESYPSPRKAVILGPGEGRSYPMGRIGAIFKADCAETDSRYSISG
jgi:hypothetical protein